MYKNCDLFRRRFAKNGCWLHQVTAKYIYILTGANIILKTPNLLLLSALQLLVGFGLLNYSFPLLPLLCPLFPIGHPIFLKSFLTSSSYLTLGLPFGLVAYGFHLYMVLATLSLVILSTCPNQLNILYFMDLTIFSLLTFWRRNYFFFSFSTPCI